MYFLPFYEAVEATRSYFHDLLFILRAPLYNILYVDKDCADIFSVTFVTKK